MLFLFKTYFETFVANWMIYLLCNDLSTGKLELYLFLNHVYLFYYFYFYYFFYLFIQWVITYRAPNVWVFFWV